MAYRRILLSILRSTSRRSASKCPVSNTNPMISTPSLFSTRGSSSAYGYLLNRTSEYATSVKPPPSESPQSDGKKVVLRNIVDEFPGKGSTGEVCRLNGNIVDVRFEEGLPQIGSILKVLDYSIRADLLVVDHLGESILRACSEDGSVDCTEGLVIGQRVLSMGLPITQSTIDYSYESDWCTSENYYSYEEDADREELEQELEDLEQEGVEQDLIPDLKQVYVKVRRYLLEKRLLQNKLFQRGNVLPSKIFSSSTLRNGSIGIVCRLADHMVDVRFHNKLWFGTTHLEVLPTTLQVFPDFPLVLKVCDIIYPLGDENECIVRATAKNGTEGLVVDTKVFGFPMYKPLCAMRDELKDDIDEIPELDDLKTVVESFREKIRFIDSENEQ